MIKFLFLISFMNFLDASRSRLIRVDGINPTCFRRPRCREFDVSGAVISVDKSLPFMGTNMCCITLSIASFTQDAYFMARILNSTKLQGDDFITFYEEDFKLLSNITAVDRDPNRIIYFKSPRISVEFFKDKEHRSIYEIVISVFYTGNSEMCRRQGFYRCSSNTSMCIDEKLMCDKFPHCPNYSDEATCEETHDESGLTYDKQIVTTVFVVIVATVLMTMILILALCFCKSKQKLTETFMAIFGYRNETKNSRMLDAQLNRKNLSGYSPIQQKN
ncbi:hypothetical protein BpHYR1_000335 [Brachionus plicatilis]|uniref:CUB domain-containing protein n=1 Tax=Brachionus plicatilis TaxID=10195 RepID=A0A3M7SCW2_BRAPC|nr:hypothetical protein BpHYR1_000335 [Brachionus plicatilis]